MKTSVIEVHDMLSVLSVDEVEKRIGQVPGVGSVTVNYAGGNATVRYDETRLAIGDVRSAVRESGYESAPPAPPSGNGEGKGSPSVAPAKATAATAPAGAASAGSASDAPVAAQASPAADEKADEAQPEGDKKPDGAAPEKT